MPKYETKVPTIFKIKKIKLYNFAFNCNCSLFPCCSESDPTTWNDYSQLNLRRAYDEREASQRIRGLIASTLSRTAADMREQADRVEQALSKRVAETEEATRNLEVELKEVRSLKYGFINRSLSMDRIEISLITIFVQDE